MFLFVPFPNKLTFQIRRADYQKGNSHFKSDCYLIPFMPQTQNGYALFLNLAFFLFVRRFALLHLAFQMLGPRR